MTSFDLCRVYQHGLRVPRTRAVRQLGVWLPSTVGQARRVPRPDPLFHPLTGNSRASEEIAEIEMSAGFIALPVALLLALAGVLAFIWSVHTGQLDDLTTPGVRMLLDDEEFTPGGGATVSDRGPGQPDGASGDATSA